MTSFPIRAQEKDTLITPKNSVLVIIDYQPLMIKTTHSIQQEDLIRNAVAVTEICKSFQVPIIVTTIGVGTGTNEDTVEPLKKLLDDVKSYDRTSMNSWEDEEFYNSVKNTNRNKIIMLGLWTEVCLAFPCLDALKEGFEVFPVVDAVGGTSKEAHDTALRRMEKAGAQLISCTQLFCELQRDWNRKNTSPYLIKALQDIHVFKKQ